jgi:hypothetical protein
MKLLIPIFALSFSLFAGLDAHAWEQDSPGLKRQMQAITKKLMPSSQYRKVKIPGLKQQVLEHRDVWQCVSPGFVNVPTNVVINGKTITMQIDIGGLMQSTDEGKTWTYASYMLEGGVTARTFFDFDINPADPKAMVIGGNRLYRTLDGGKTWSESYKGLPPLKHFTRGNGYGQVKYTCDGRTVFAATGTKVTMPVGWEKVLRRHYTEKFILFSRDNGDSFQTIKLARPFAMIKKIVPHPTRPGTVYFSFADGDFWVTQNANAAKPTLRRLTCVPEGQFVRDMSVNPANEHDMLLTLSAIEKPNRNPSSLYRSADCLAAELRIARVPVIGKDGQEFTCKDLMTVGFNPNKAGQIVLGEGHSPNLYISDDNASSFYQYALPKRFFCDGNLGHFYGAIERVYFGASGTAVVVSKIGSWITTDNFKSLRDLTMKYDKGLFSHRGVGTPANINNIAICGDKAFFSAQDHGAWISNGTDYMQWKRLTGKNDQAKFPLQPAPWGGEYTWLHHVEKIFASHDGNFVYINCNAMIKKKFKHPFWANKKFFQTRNSGETWHDVTPRLGKGDLYPEGSEFLKVLFDPADSAKHWFLTSDALHYTEDGGRTFTQLHSNLFDSIKADDDFMFADLAFDSRHQVLYLSARVAPTLQSKKLNHASSPAALYRSVDRGKTWEVYDIGQNAVCALGVTDSGTLAVGTQKTADQPARLIVIPYGKTYDESMVKLTLGDTPEEISANQICIKPIVCDGNDILAYSNNDWIHTDRFFAQGPLLSRDDGKTFTWINYTLPSTNIWSATMKDGKIMLGTTFGLMYWKYK